MHQKTKFAFFGTGDFAVKILDILYQNDFIPELVITTTDKPKGRKLVLTPPPVKIWTQKKNIKTITIEQCAALGAAHCDLFIVADYGKIIPKEVLDIPKYGALNIHPSLLPKYRGPSPIQSFILSGEKETGTSIILLDEELDHGPILTRQKLSVENLANLAVQPPLGGSTAKLNYKQLEEKLAELGGELLVETINDWVSGEIKPIPQKHDEATYTKKITKKDGEIDLNGPAEIIERKIRAFTPWPGAYFFANGKRIIITDAELDEKEKLKIKRVKPEGKKEMDFADFLRGNPHVNLSR